MYRLRRPPTVRERVASAEPEISRSLLIAKCFYFCYFGAIGTITPFFNVYLEQSGLTGQQIGWISSIPPLVALIANPFWGAIADRWQMHRTILAVLTFGAGSISLLFLTSVQFWAVLIFVIAMTFFRRPTGAIIDSTTVSLVKQSNTTYGRQRLWGSLGFALISYSLGRWLTASDLALAFWAHAFILCIACTAFGLLLPVQGGNKKAVDIIGGLRQLAKRRSYLGFLCAVAFFGFGMAGYITFLSLHMLDLGGSTNELGIMWLIMGGIEVPILFFGARRIEVYGYRRILRLSFVGLTLGWGAIGFATQPIHLMLIVALVGACFSCYWVSVVNYADEAAPEGMSATAQAITGSIQSGLGWSIGAICSGYLWDNVDSEAVFFMGAVAAALAGVIFWVSNR